MAGVYGRSGGAELRCPCPLKTTDNGANLFTQLDFLGGLMKNVQLQVGILLESV